MSYSPEDGNMEVDVKDEDDTSQMTVAFQAYITRSFEGWPDRMARIKGGYSLHFFGVLDIIPFSESNSLITNCLLSELH